MTDVAALIRAAVKDEGAVWRLQKYVALLEKWSKKHSLVRFRDLNELVHRHILEAVAGIPLLPAGGVLGDVGSGAGLPGIPLLVCRRDLAGVLIEPRSKRCAFLQLVIRELELHTRVERCRLEDLESVPAFSMLTMRAVRADDTLLEASRQRLFSGGRLVLWSTQDEYERLRRKTGWRVISSPLPDLDRGVLIEMEPCFT